MVGVQGLSPLEVTITRQGSSTPVRILSLTEYFVLTTPPEFSHSQYVATWDGRDSSGNYVSDGDYVITVSRWDQQLASTTVTVFCGTGQLTSIRISPDPFNPNVESTEITVTGTPGLTLSAGILREGWWEPVQQITFVEGPSGTYKFIWDGMHMHGYTALDGEYIVAVAAQPSGPVLISGTVTLRSDEVLYQISATPDPFNPVIGQTTFITATGTPGLGPLELWVLKEGWWEPVQILPMVEIDGSYTTRWDGMHMHGYVAPDGEYILSVGSSSLGELITGTVTIDTVGAGAATMRIRLTWNSDETDFDLHLLKPGGEFWGEGDCYFGNDWPDWDGDGEYYDPNDPANSDENDPYLDIDDTDGYGPEHITIYSPPPGTYRVIVHYYDDYPYGPSDATVKVTLFEGTPSETVTTYGPHQMNEWDQWDVTDITIGGLNDYTNGAMDEDFAALSDTEILNPRNGKPTTLALDSRATVVAAEYFIDSVGTDGTGQPMNAADGTFDSVTENVVATVDVTGLSIGQHQVYVHGKDSDGNWGPTASTTISVTGAGDNKVYFVPEESKASFCKTTQVELWVDATDFQSGQINLTYNPECAEITGWTRNTANFPMGTWAHTDGNEWITFVGGELKTGSYMIGTLTVHCACDTNDCPDGCTTTLGFLETGENPCKLVDDYGNAVTTTWMDGTFQCIVGVCGDVNCDGTVDIGDVTLLLNHVGNPTKYALCNDWAGDVKCDQTKDIGDVTLLLNHVGNPTKYQIGCC
jgi:flagellar hook assembly protein FlgD